MMEALDRMRERETRRLGPEILNPVEIRSLEDIKRVVAEFDPAKNPAAPVVPVNTVIRANTERGEHNIQVSADTKSRSKRDHLIEGLDTIKRWMEHEDKMQQLAVATEVNGTEMKPALIGSGGRGKTWVDQLITQWLGGYRDGLYIYWDLNDGFLYKYDAYQHRLTRIRKVESTDPSPI
jgi:hypothetical protein